MEMFDDRTSKGPKASAVKLAASLPSLPEELIEKICQEITSFKSKEKPLHTLSNLCRTSKLFDRVARPVLFRNVDLIGIEDLLSFIECLGSQPDLAKSMRSLTIKYYQHDFTAHLEPSFLRDRILRYISQTLGARQQRLLVGVNHVGLIWLMTVESVLLQGVELTDLIIHVDGNRSYSQILSEYHQRNGGVEGDLLPRLRNLTIHVIEKAEDILGMVGFFSSCELETVTCIDCGVPAFSRDLGLGPITTYKKFDSIRKLRVYNSTTINPENVLVLLQACRQLEEFHFAITEQDDEDEEDSHLLTPQEIVTSLLCVRHTLKTLSITTESWGGDDGFPSLRNFTALENLRLDVFELADYNEDGTDESSDTDSDSDSDSNTSQDQDVQPGNHPSNSMDWEDTNSDTSSESDDSNSSDSSSDADGECKPILHLLPRTLKTLWLDNLYTLDGDLDYELIKLAQTAKDDFVDLKTIIIEGADEAQGWGTLKKHIEEGGIEFVKKPLRHFWYLEEGLAEPLED